MGRPRYKQMWQESQNDYAIGDLYLMAKLTLIGE